MGWKPGSVAIYTISITSPRGYVDLSALFISSRVYESIYAPNVVLEVDVMDSSDIQGILNLVGDETLTFSFGPPGLPPVTYTCGLNLIGENENLSANKSKIYTCHGVGKETFYSKTNYVQKAYNTDVSSIIRDIHSTFLNSVKNLFTESTQGIQNILIPNKKPFDAIDMVRRRAVSSINPSSTFLYFENAAGMYFKTIEGMFSQSATKTYIRANAINESIFNNEFNNILVLEVPQIAASLDRIDMGGLKQRVATYNIRTRKYQFQDISPQDGKYGNAGSYNSSNFKQEYGQNFGRMSMIPQDTANRPFTGIDQMTPNQLAYLSNLVQNTLKLQCFGDSTVKAGDIVNLEIPQVTSTTGAPQLDLQLSGNFLVTRLCRNIDIAGKIPRYTDNMECINGSLANGV